MRTIAHLTVPADPVHLATCRMALVGATRQLNLPDDRLDDLKLVLTEACANAIERSNSADVGDIELDLRTSQNMIEVAVIDHGGQVTPGRGLGLPLLRRLCTSLDTTPGVGGKGMVVTFSLALDGEAAR